MKHTQIEDMLWRCLLMKREHARILKDDIRGAKYFHSLHEIFDNNIRHEVERGF